MNRERHSVLRRENRARVCVLFAGLAAGFFAFAVPAVAQEGLRASIANADSAAARREAQRSAANYNLKLLDTSWNFSAGVGAEYNDNANLSHGKREGDLILRPSADIAMFWPLTRKNALNLSVGIGYSEYLYHPRLNRLFVTPGSELAFDLFVKDVVITFHERPSLTENSFQDPTVSGSGDFAQFQNTAGVSATWDMNKAVLSLGYDHNNYFSLGSAKESRDGSSDITYAQLGLKVTHRVQVGVEGGMGWIQYSGTNASDAVQWNSGMFVKVEATRYISFRASAGYTVYSPEVSGTNASQDTALTYLDLSMTHRLNKRLTYTVSGGRGVSLTLFGQTYQNYNANLALTWNLFKKNSMSTSFGYNSGVELVGKQTRFSQYVGTIDFSRPLGEKLSGAFGYGIALREDDANIGNYVVNTVHLNFSYRF